MLSPKGGSGKSTISLNLARALQLDGYSVVVADSDIQGTAMSWSSIEKDDDFFSVYGISQKSMEREVNKARDMFDFIIIDGSAKLEVKLLASSIKASDLILIPLRPSGADIWASEELVEGIKARQIILDGKPLAYFIVSSQITGTGMAVDVSEILSDYELPVLESRTSQRISFAEALTDGVTVFERDRDGKAKGEIVNIKNEVLRILNG